VIPSPPDPFPAVLRLTALYSIHHDAALPYLTLIAREWKDWYAMMAIRRLGSPAAEEAFRALTSRNDDIGRRARLVADARLEEPLIGGGWETEEP